MTAPDSQGTFARQAYELRAICDKSQAMIPKWLSYDKLTTSLEKTYKRHAKFIRHFANQRANCWQLNQIADTTPSSSTFKGDIRRCPSPTPTPMPVDTSRPSFWACC